MGKIYIFIFLVIKTIVGAIAKQADACTHTIKKNLLHYTQGQIY